MRWHQVVKLYQHGW